MRNDGVCGRCRSAAKPNSHTMFVFCLLSRAASSECMAQSVDEDSNQTEKIEVAAQWPCRCVKCANKKEVSSLSAISLHARPNRISDLYSIYRQSVSGNNIDWIISEMLSTLIAVAVSPSIQNLFINVCRFKNFYFYRHKVVVVVVAAAADDGNFAFQISLDDDEEIIHYFLSIALHRHRHLDDDLELSQQLRSQFW